MSAFVSACTKIVYMGGVQTPYDSSEFQREVKSTYLRWRAATGKIPEPYGTMANDGHMLCKGRDGYDIAAGCFTFASRTIRVNVAHNRWKDIMLHEVGHAFGATHTETNGTAMHPNRSGGVITTEDVKSACASGGCLWERPESQ